MRRHELEQLDPHLSEHVIYFSPAGEVSVAGVPIHLAPSWLAEEMIAGRLAPEEMMREQPRKEGDLWRAGQALSALGAKLELPGELAALLEDLSCAESAAAPAAGFAGAGRAGGALSAGFARAR